MKVTICRDSRNRSKYHVHPYGSVYGESSQNEGKVDEADMPEAVYQTLAGKFSSRGFVVIPDDIASSEPASDWWSVVSMLVR